MPPARPGPASIPAQIGRFVRSLTAGELVKLWSEEWIGTLLRPIPGLLGFTLRYLLYRFLFKELGGFCFIYAGARLTHTYGIRAGRNFRRTLHLQRHCGAELRRRLPGFAPHGL